MKSERAPEPPAKAFSQQFGVPEQAIDELGHVSNVEWVRFIGQVAAAHSDSVGLNLSAYQQLGLLWVVRRHVVNYLAEAVLGDVIDAYTWISDVRGATSQRVTRFERSGQLLVHAETTWAMIDLLSRRPRRVPEELLARYSFTRPPA